MFWSVAVFVMTFQFGATSGRGTKRMYDKWMRLNPQWCKTNTQPTGYGEGDTYACLVSRWLARTPTQIQTINA